MDSSRLSPIHNFHFNMVSFSSISGMADELKHEINFCEANGMIKNENGVYAYQSIDGKDSLSLTHILKEFREYLEDKGITMEYQSTRY